MPCWLRPERAPASRPRQIGHHDDRMKEWATTSLQFSGRKPFYRSSQTSPLPPIKGLRRTPWRKRPHEQEQGCPRPQSALR